MKRLEYDPEYYWPTIVINEGRPYVLKKLTRQGINNPCDVCVTCVTLGGALMASADLPRFVQLMIVTNHGILKKIGLLGISRYMTSLTLIGWTLMMNCQKKKLLKISLLNTTFKYG